MINTKDPYKAVVDSRLYRTVLEEAKKITPNAEVNHCFYYRLETGMIFKKYSDVHFYCLVTLGVTSDAYLKVEDDKIKVDSSDSGEIDKLKGLGKMILRIKNPSDSCVLALKNKEDVFISDVPSVRMNKGAVIS